MVIATTGICPTAAKECVAAYISELTEPPHMQAIVNTYLIIFTASKLFYPRINLWSHPNIRLVVGGLSA